MLEKYVRIFFVEQTFYPSMKCILCSKEFSKDSFVGDIILIMKCALGKENNHSFDSRMYFSKWYKNAQENKNNTIKKSLI